MRDSHERRQPHATSQFPIGDIPLELTGIERRKTSDRRKEKLTLVERQLMFSEMPSPPRKSD